MTWLPAIAPSRGNQLQFVQAVERSTNLGPLAYLHERFGIVQALGQRICIFYMVPPDFNVMAIKLLENMRVYATYRGNRPVSKSFMSVRLCGTLQAFEARAAQGGLALMM